MRKIFEARSDMKEHILTCAKNPLYFFDTELKIITKEGSLEPLQVNSVQAEMVREFAKSYSSEHPARLIILKARQMGATTITAALNFWNTIFHKYTSGLTLTHDDDSKDHVFAISKRFLNHLVENLKPAQKYSNRKELVFEGPAGSGLNSQMQIDIASPDVVSKTVHFFHGSEVSRWKNATESYIAAMQMVPDHEKSVVILESTANGMGGLFYDLWQDAIVDRNDYTPLFYPWFAMDFYRKVPPEGFIFDDDFKILKKKYKLDDEQLYFYVWTLRNKCGNNIDLMRQEYPCNATECFLASGRNAFIGLKHYEGQIIKPELGEIKKTEVGRRFIPVRNGHVQLWRPPKKKHRYMIGIDVSEGIEGGDRSAAVVLDRDSYEVVALWWGLAAPDIFAGYCMDIGIYYNNAVLVPEINASGLSVLNEFRRCGYKKLYSRKEYENIEKRFIYKLGWKTTSRTRPLIVDELRKIIREHILLMYSSDILSELITFIYTDSGKAEAQSGCHDDLVLALAIVMWANQETPLPNHSAVIKKKTRIQEMIEKAEKSGDEPGGGFLQSYLGEDF